MLNMTLEILSVLIGFFLLLGVRYVPNRRVGIVEKRWSFRGSVKGDTIEGNVTIGGSAVGQRVMPWSARQTVRGEMRMGNDGVAMAGIQ